MNPLHKFMSDVKDGGVSVELKRQTEHGILAPVKDQEMKALGTKARIASTAQLLEKLTPDEKLDWAVETKDEGNALFAEGKYVEAMEKYVEALAASDFGSKPRASTKTSVVDTSTESSCEEALVDASEGNIDDLVVPVLSNLAACCMRTEQWHKAISFAEQALLLRPACPKALYRMGKSQLQIAEYKKAKESFLRAKEIMDNHTQAESEDSQPPMVEAYLLSAADYKSIASLVAKANEGIRKDRLAAENMKKSLQKAFAPPPLPPQPPQDPAPTAPTLEVLPMSFTELLVYMMEMAFKFFMRLIGVEFRTRKKNVSFAKKDN